MGGIATITTRYGPKRADEMLGGSLYWIIAHKLVARQLIAGFGEADGGRVAIRLALPLVPVLPVARRAHQGWRYLAATDAPPDLDSAMASGDALPPAMMADLAALGLIEKSNITRHCDPGAGRGKQSSAASMPMDCFPRPAPGSQ